MVTRVQRLLAAFDIVVHKLFRMMHDRYSGGEGTPYGETYWHGLGKKFAIVAPDGNVRVLGNSWWTEHRYDAQGSLLSRHRLVTTARPKDRIIYGDSAVHNAYDNQPSRTGGSVIIS